MKELLISGIDRLGISLSSSQIEQLLSLQSQLLKWNSAYNLTAITDEQDVVKLHLLDSLAIVPGWSFEKTLDVGTGPGFPGLPLAIALPERQFHLLDSNSKKIRFIRQQIHQLSLKNVEVFHSRVENHPISDYDAIVSRAFASISDMVNLTKSLLNKDGRWMAMKGVYSNEEMQELPDDVKTVKITELKIPGVKAERCLVELARRND